MKAAKPATAQHGEPAPEYVGSGGLNGLNATDATFEKQGDAALDRAVRIFEARCEARAVLAASGLLDFHDAVDGLQAAAVRDGLVSAIGQDAVQILMAEAFRQ